MPDVAPVTSKTLPSNSWSINVSFVFFALSSPNSERKESHAKAQRRKGRREASLALIIFTSFLCELCATSVNISFALPSLKLNNYLLLSHIDKMLFKS
jgi:hypothetical protein